ncbi:MAG: hypothetical protein WCX81_00145 [Monoglobales bacterium]
MGETVSNLRGQGATNQGLMCIEGSLYAYLSFPHLTSFKDHFDLASVGATYPSTMGDYIGQTSSLGYWAEGGTSDGASYGRMCEGMWDNLVQGYLTEIPEDQQNPITKAKLIEATDRFLNFDSFFYMPEVNGFPSVRSAAFTGRVNSPYGGGSAITGNAYIAKIFPRAKKNWLVQVAHSDDYRTLYAEQGAGESEDGRFSGSGTVASVITNDGWAYNHLRYYIRNIYDDIFQKSSPDSYIANNSMAMWKNHHEHQWFEDSEMPTLPFEMQGDYNIYNVNDQDQMLGLKHKGIYYQVWFGLGEGKQHGYSAYAYNTLAPMGIWDEYFGTILASQKPKDIDTKGKKDGNIAMTNSAHDFRGRFTKEDVLTSGIVGTDGAGQLYMEGKQYEPDLKWIEQGKSFELVNAVCPWSGKAPIYRYFMTEEGTTIEAGLDAVAANEDLWVQLPLVDSTSKVDGLTITYSDADNTVVYAHNGKTLTISWDEGVESQWVQKRGPESGYRELLLKLTPDKPMIKIYFSRNVGDYVYKLPY